MAATAAEHLEEHHPQRVEIGALVERARRAAGLLGRDVRERAFERLGGAGRRGFRREARGDAEVRQQHALQRLVDEHVVRPDVLVHQAGGVHALERARHPQPEPQAHADGKPLAFREHPVERTKAGVLEHECHRAVVLLECVRAHHARHVRKLHEHLVLMRQASHHARAGHGGDRRLERHLVARFAVHAAAHPRLGRLGDGLPQHVVAQRFHGLPPPGGSLHLPPDIRM
jgi:hypothetical protein